MKFNAHNDRKNIKFLLMVRTEGYKNRSQTASFLK